MDLLIYLAEVNLKVAKTSSIVLELIGTLMILKDVTKQKGHVDIEIEIHIKLEKE